MHPITPTLPFLGDDFVLLLGATAQCLLGAVCVCAGRSSLRRLPLYWLGAFGLLSGAACCLELWAYSSPESFWAVALRSAMYLGSMVCLVEFWSEMHVRVGGRRGAALWAYALLMAVYFAAFGTGVINPLRAAGVVFGILSGLLASWALARAARSEATGRALLFVAALAMAVVAGGGVVAACGLSMQPVSKALEAGGGLELFGVWMTLRAGAAAVLAVSLWLFSVALSPKLLRQRVRWIAVLLPLLGAVLLLTAFSARREAGECDAQLRRDLLSRAQVAAAGLDHERALILATGDEQDRREAYDHLKSRLEAIEAVDDAVDTASLYALGGERPRVLAVSTRPGEYGARAPGREAPLRAAPTAEAFPSAGSGLVLGPYRDSWGVFVTAHVPVARAGWQGGPLVALGLDVQAGQWQRELALARRPALLLSLLGSGLLLACFVGAQLLLTQVHRTADSERKYRLLFHSMQEGVAYCRIVSDEAGRPRDYLFLDVNPALEALTGIPRERALGRTARELFPDLQDELYRWVDFMNTVAGTQRTRSAEMFYPPRGVWFNLRVFSWEPGYFAMTVSDITQRKATEDEQRRQALHDPLTDLPNRRLFRDRLEQALARADRTGASCAVFYMDLNEFKAVNDTHGHQWGDKVLREVARRFSACIRKSDTLARIGGDEFTAVIFAADDHGTIEAVAEKIQHAMDAPFEVAGQAVRLGVSIGVSVYPRHGDDAQTILTRADVAMYRGKGDKSLRFVLYE